MMMIRRMFYKLMPDRMIWGGRVMANYRSLLNSQWWSADRLASHQLERLRAMVAYAFDYSPFYRKLYQEAGAHPDDIKSFANFAALPCVTKTDIRDHLEAMKSREFDRVGATLRKTGGTTGMPLHTYSCEINNDWFTALNFRLFEWGGCHYSDSKFTLFAVPLAVATNMQTETYFDPKYRMLVVRPMHTDEAQLDQICDMIRDFKPGMFRGLVEYFRLLARFIERKGYSDLTARAMFLQGEVVTPTDRGQLESAFQTRVYDYYGMNENAVSASECESGGLHLNSELVYVETEPVATDAADGDLGELIGTNLYNRAVPIIRYRTRDIGRLRTDTCACGRALPLLKLKGGRTRDFVITRRHLIYMPMKTAELAGVQRGVRELQFYQPDIDNLVVRVVPNERFDNSRDSDNLREEVSRLTNSDLSVSVDIVNEIPRSASGKFRYVISKVEQPL